MKATDVTVEMGLEAFEKTGLYPVCGLLYEENYLCIHSGNREKRPCGCLLGAIFLAQGVSMNDGTASEDVVLMFEPEDQIDKESGHEAAWNLATGFDDGIMCNPDRPDPDPADDIIRECDKHCYFVGYEVGRKMQEKRNHENFSDADEG